MVKDNPRLVYLYECRQAFLLIKEQIRNCSSFNRRTDLVYLMYIACTVNNDEKALLDLLQYLLTVHRNNMDVLGRVLNGILSWPALEKLNEVYWSHIMDIALILESSPTSVSDKKDVYTKYIFHAIEYNKECERECKILVHEIADRCSSSPVEIHAGRKRKRFAQKIAPEILLESITSQSTNTSEQFDQAKNKFMLKKLMMKQLHLLGNPSEIFTIIAEHCIGKYSRHVLSALSRIAYNTPELLIREELMKFVNETSQLPLRKYTRNLFVAMTNDRPKAIIVAKMHNGDVNKRRIGLGLD
ncbi:hypothetical protein Trydic_g7550 [Trypoxylus dichotomus]